jgi:HEAT repeat protein
MILLNSNQQPEYFDRTTPFAILPPEFETQPRRQANKLLAALSPDTPWGERQIAASRLGNMRSREALPGLLAALPADPFWMVRCAIIQALEKIDDSRAIPTLRQVAQNDGFQVVRSCAATAIARLSR